MNNLPGLAAEPEWKQYLRLGEQLLSQSDLTAQSRLIEQTLTNLLGCQAVLWLASPLYPLPSQNAHRVLPNPAASRLVNQALNQKQVLFQIGTESVPTQPSAQKSFRCCAFPLITRDILLGILEVNRLQGPAFRPEEIAFLEGFSAHTALSLEISRQISLKNWRLEQLSLVRSVSSQIANVLDLDELCHQIVELIQETFNLFQVSIFTTNNIGDELHFRASAGTLNHHLPSIQNHLIQNRAVRKALNSRKDEVLDDQHLESVSLPDGTQITIRSEIALPILQDSQVMGVLDIQSDRENAFHEVDVLVFHALADNIAAAFKNTRLFHALNNRNTQISSVFEITHTLTSILNLDSLLESAVEAIHRHFGFTFVYIFAVHSGRRKIFYLSGSGMRSKAMLDLNPTFDLDDPHGIVPWVARTNQTRLTNDTSQDPLYRPSEFPPDDTRSELTIPLAFGGDVLGVLDIQSDQLSAFNPEILPILESLAASLAIAFHNARLYKNEQWRRQVGDSFREVAALLSSNTALEDLLETILNELERNLPCEASAVWLVNENDNTQPVDLHLAAVRGITSEKITQALSSSEQAHDFIYMALHNTEPTIRRSSDPFGPLGMALDYPPDYSSIAAPLRIGNHPIGILTLAHHTAGRYGSEARSMTITFASYAAVAIQIARLYSQAQEQAWISTILLQVAEASQSANSVEELLSTMVRLSRMLVGIKKSAIYIFDPDRQTFELRAWYGMENLPENLAFPAGRAPALDQLRSVRETTFVMDAAAELDLPAAQVPADTGTLVLLPLMSRDELRGVFLIAHQSTQNPGVLQTFDQQTLSVYQGLAHQTAVALENLHLVEARQEEAYVTAVLLQVAQAVVSQNDLVDILDTIVHLTPILVGIDACIIYLWDESSNAFRPVQAFTGSLQDEIKILEKPYYIGDSNILDTIIKQDSACYALLPDDLTNPLEWNGLETDSIASLENSPLDPGTRWVLAFPLSVRGKLVGAMLTQDRSAITSSQQRRLEIMNGIAQQIALAIQNDLLRQETIAQERINREIQLARQIQQTFLPNKLPHRPSWETAARWQPAREVGGDFYDMFTLNKNRLGIAIADVSDKGMPAALYMTVGRTLIRAYANSAKSASTLLQRINTPLVTDTPNSMFITAIYAVLWPETGHLMYANAGHNRPYILRPNRMEVEQLPKGGMAMGVLEKIHLEDSLHVLEPGDCLLLYTDGVTESFSPSGEAFGENRLENILRLNIHKNVNELLDILETSLNAFREGASPTDDITMVAIRRLPAL